VRKDDQDHREPEEQQAAVLSAREAMSLISSDTEGGQVHEQEQEKEEDRPEPES
jgi:hypothetical protein